MPHFVVEYSANLDEEIRLPELFEKLHEAAVATGVFPIGGIRSRAVRCTEYRVADGDPGLAFVHMTLKIGHGRSLEVRREVGEKLFAVLKDHLAPVFERRYFGISFELTELHPELNFRLNNIHERFGGRR